MAAPIAWRLNWSAFWKSGCVGQLYTKQTKKTKNFVIHPPEASPISGSQALAPAEVPNWLAGGSPLRREGSETRRNPKYISYPYIRTGKSQMEKTTAKNSVSHPNFSYKGFALFFLRGEGLSF